MNKLIVINIVRFVFLSFLQIMIFSLFQNEYHLQFFVYLLFILMLPYQTPHWLLLTSSFALGLLIDTYSGGIGLHAGAATLAAFVRIILLKNSYFSINGKNDDYQSFKRTGFVRYSIFLLIILFVHHSFYFLMEAYSASQLLFTTLLTLGTIVSSYILILISFFLFSPQNKK